MRKPVIDAIIRIFINLQLWIYGTLSFYWGLLMVVLTVKLVVLRIKARAGVNKIKQLLKCKK